MALPFKDLVKRFEKKDPNSIEEPPQRVLKLRKVIRELYWRDYSDREIASILNHAGFKYSRPDGRGEPERYYEPVHVSMCIRSRYGFAGQRGMKVKRDYNEKKLKMFSMPLYPKPPRKSDLKVKDAFDVNEGKLTNRLQLKFYQALKYMYFDDLDN